MPAKTKEKKNSTPHKKVLRFKPKINLLKNLNAVFLVAGFAASLITIVALSSNGHKYDIRSRGQVVPTVTVTITPSVVPSVTPES